VSGGGRGRLTAAWALTGSVVAVAAGLVAWALPATVRFLPDAASNFWAITLLGTVVDVPLYGVARRLTRPVRTTFSACFTFAIFLLWGAAPAITAQALAGLVAAITQGYTPRGAIFLTSRLVCALAACQLGVTLAGASARPGPILATADVAAFSLPAGIWFVTSYGLLVSIRACAHGGNLVRALGDLREDVLATTASMLLASPLLITMTGWWPVLVAVPLMALGQLTRLFAVHEDRLRREPVTGLLNRSGLIFGLEMLTAHDQLDPLHPRPLALAVVNVEAVLALNRSLGRGFYERAVAAAANRLSSTFGADTVGRLSGEAFVVLLPGLSGADAVEAAGRAAKALEPMLVVDGIPINADPAVGLALYPQHGRDFATLLSNAELAMAEVRRRGERVGVYVPQTQVEPRRRIALLSQLHAALTDPARHGEIVVVYQPQVYLDSGRLAGAEALVRWTHPEWGPVNPEELFEVVEPTDVMHMLTRHVLERVVVQLRDWRAAGLPVRVAVNASAQDLRAPGFIDELRDLLARHGVEPAALVIEITERLLLEDSERVARVAEAIVGLGVGLSLDDFGTGHASLQQLRRLPLTEVKIDKSYVLGVTGSPAQRAIVTSVHALAQALDLSVVAEGVADERIARQLARLPGIIGQGFHFGHPMSPEQFATLARRLSRPTNRAGPSSAVVTGRTPRP
jgi:diguanylate cyclase (GGDEF)-like protein